MFRVSPAVRMSLGLMFISITVLMLSNFVGLIPDHSRVAMELRKNTAESLAVRATYAARDRSLDSIKDTLESIRELNPEIVSLGMRLPDGRYIAQSGDHQNHWVASQGGISTFTHWQVPIHKGEQQWATLEVSFIPREGVSVLGYKLSPFSLPLVFSALTSFIGFVIFMRRSLRYLDPSSVMPNRVRYALDTLVEGVLLLDNKERIILANSVIAQKLGRPANELVGVNAAKLNWIDPGTNVRTEVMPWAETLRDGKNRPGILFNIETKPQGVLKLMVNSAPVLDDKGVSRGAVVTFDDVTEMEKRDFQLSRMVEMLQMSRDKIKQKNRELEVLAKTDPLTGCLNRRAFYAIAKPSLETSAADGRTIACIMVDLDFFKSINDTYGHAVGDRVIQFAADTLKANVRGDDEVCRYGGEEFCILLPDCSVADAAARAEKIRSRIESQGAQTISAAPKIQVSASLGVSDSTNGVSSIEDLFAQADRALYKAKEEGRNRVVVWDRARETEFQQKDLIS